MAAATRTLLIRRAADAWSVGPDTLTLVGWQGRAWRHIERRPLDRRARDARAARRDGHRRHRHRASVGLARRRDAASKIGGVDFVTGRHEYTSDLKRPGMRYGRDRACAANRRDAFERRRRPRRKRCLVSRSFTRVSFLASSPTAHRPRQRRASLIKAEWTRRVRCVLADALRRLEEVGAARCRERRLRERRCRSGAWPARSRTFQSSYTVAYIAHCPLEPRAAVAEWKDDNLTVWTGTQRPFGVQGELADAFHLPRERVRVIVPDTGSAYGGKHTGEAAIEAARLARASANASQARVVARRGTVLGVFPTCRRDRRAERRRRRQPIGRLGVSQLQLRPFRHSHAVRDPAPAHRLSSRAVTAAAGIVSGPGRNREPLRARIAHGRSGVGAWDRAAGVSSNASQRRSHPRRTAGSRRSLRMDRSPSALQGEASAWPRGTEKGGYVATCAEVAIDGAAVRVRRAVVAFECGAIVNPDGLRNQVEGAVAQGTRRRTVRGGRRSTPDTSTPRISPTTGCRASATCRRSTPCS